MLSHNFSVAMWGCHWRPTAVFTNQTRPEVIYEHYKTINHSQSGFLHFISIYLIMLLVTRAGRVCAVNKKVKKKEIKARLHAQDRLSHLWARPSRVRGGLRAEQKSERLRRFLESQHATKPAFFQAADGRGTNTSSEQVCGFTLRLQFCPIRPTGSPGVVSGDYAQRYTSVCVCTCVVRVRVCVASAKLHMQIILFCLLR